MNTLEFVSYLIDSLAWPATIVTLIILFRSPLRSVLQQLTQFRFGDFEMNFGSGIRRIKDRAEKIGMKSSSRVSAATTKTLDSSQIIVDALQLARNFPGPAVVLAWSAIEQELLQAIMRLAISSDYPPYNSSVKNIRILRKRGYLDSDTFKILERMRQLRNAAAHPSIEGGRSFSDDATEFVDVAGAVTEKLKRLTR